MVIYGDYTRQREIIDCTIEENMPKILERYQQIERSIITTYRKTIWSPFVLAVKKYRLIDAGDKIAVCISGGKDSMLLAKLMQELHRHSEVPFELVFLVMDPGYNAENRKRIEENAALLRVPITVFESDIFEVATLVGGDSPCYLCARMRRGHLYAKAKELGCNKIALGHHLQDVVETFFLSLLYEGRLSTMKPKSYMSNSQITLIRPLFLTHEKTIRAVSKDFPVKKSKCPADTDSKRQDIEKLIDGINELIPDSKKRIESAIILTDSYNLLDKE